MTPRSHSLLVAALLAAIGLMVLPSASASAPQAAPPAPPSSPATAASAPPPSPAASAGKADDAVAVESPAYTYEPRGRRDPFVSLLRRGSEASRRGGTRTGGLAGLESADVVLKGTMQSRSGYVALVEGTDRKTYIVKTGDRLLDGMVRTITADAMVILQQVNDPLSLDKQREVRKILRQTDEVK